MQLNCSPVSDAPFSLPAPHSSCQTFHRDFFFHLVHSHPHPNLLPLYLKHCNLLTCAFHD